MIWGRSSSDLRGSWVLLLGSWSWSGCWTLLLQLRSGDVDLVLDAAVSPALLHSLAQRADQVLPDPEGSIEPVLGHGLTQSLQDVVPVSIAGPLTLSQDDQTLGRLRGRTGGWWGGTRGGVNCLGGAGGCGLVLQSPLSVTQRLETDTFGLLVRVDLETRDTVSVCVCPTCQSQS